MLSAQEIEIHVVKGYPMTFFGCLLFVSMLFLDHWYLVEHITQVSKGIWYTPGKGNISETRAILSSHSKEKGSAHDLAQPRLFQQLLDGERLLQHWLPRVFSPPPQIAIPNKRVRFILWPGTHSIDYLTETIFQETIFNLVTRRTLFFAILFLKYAHLELILRLTNGLRTTVWKTPSLRILADLEKR